jgi:2-methylisocitrate lyase-like PEP mutase family enzyme
MTNRHKDDHISSGTLVKRTHALRQHIRSGKTLHAVGAHDAISALLIERAGFDCVYVGSYSTQATFLGKPDLDFMSKTERLMITRHIVKATNLPVIVDVEEGYGNAINVMDCVRDFEAIGVAGMHLDDERMPSKCPVMRGIPPAELISVEEMCGKIRAAVSARLDPDLLIIVRSDVVGTVSRDEYYSRNLKEEVVRRSNAYAEAGADAIMIMGFDEAELCYYAESIGAPLVGLYATAEPLAFKEFEKHHYAMAIGTIAPLYMYMRALIDGLEELKRTQDWNAVKHRMITDDEFFDLLKFEDYRRMYEHFSIS